LPVDPRLAELQRLLAELRTGLVGAEKDGQDNQMTLQAIFRTNNELGRVAREDPSLRPALVELQLRLNSVTVELKRGRRATAWENFLEAEERFGQLSGESGA
jgi:hypothetical protein